MLTTKMVDVRSIRPGRTRASGSSRVVVRENGDEYVVVDGHGVFHEVRDRAERIACLVRTEDSPDPEDRLAEHLAVGHLNPVAEARLLAAVMRRNSFSQGALSRAYGIPRTHISKRVALLRLSREEQGLVEAGRITVEAALRRARAAPPRP